MARRTRDTPTLIALSIAGVLASAQGHASGFALLEQSASRLGTAFAGTAAAADDSTTVYFNPAGLTELDHAEFSAVASGIEITSTFRNDASLAAFGQPLGTDGGDAGDWNFVPAGYFAIPLGDRWAFGMGVNAPFGLKLEYADDWIGRFQALNSEIVTYNFNPSIAFAVNDRVSLGIGVSYQRLQAELSNAVNYSAVVAQGVQQLVATGQLDPASVPAILAANAGLEGHTVVRGDDAAWGYNLGALVHLSDTVRLGVSYRSSLSYTVEGTVNFTSPTPTDPIGTAIVAAASAPGGQLADGGARVDLEVPDSAIASLVYAPTNSLELMADVAWTGWSSVQELRVVRESGETLSVTPELWEDTWRYAIGAAFRVNEAFTLRGGLGYDESPVPASTRTPRLPDPARRWVAIGAQWRVSEAITLDAGYAHLFSGDVQLDQDGENAAANGVIDGTQSSNVDIVSVQLAYRFR